MPSPRMRSSMRPSTTFGPTDFHLFAGERVPDPITFVLSPKWLNRPNLYPRQATLLKIIFLRTDLLTEYDHDVIDEWEQSFVRSGNNGITPGIRERMKFLKALGYPWFREALLVLGRRAGKGYVSALAMAYVLWSYLALGDPQGHFGVDRDKQLACFIYAGKKEQARENLWKDLTNVVTGGPCFAKYISRPLGESLSVFAPHDFVRMERLRKRGIVTERDLATFLIQPKEATLMSGRGPTSFAQGYDEMAHVIATGANRSAEEVYGAATPALDQFKKWAFIIEPSSPWQQIGQFYMNWEMSLALDESGKPENPQMMMIQLCSWEMYYDWQDAHLIPLFPEDFTGDLDEYVDSPHPELVKLKQAIQEYDDGMRRLEKSNPDTFKVERRSHWQATIDAYLNPDMIRQMFEPWNGRMLTMQTQGRLSMFYKAHADPSLANANFGFAIAHPETDDDGIVHCVFDVIHHWQPSDFPDNMIHYPTIDEHLWQYVRNFMPDEFTFDQWNSANSIARLNENIRKANFPKQVVAYEKTATAKHNWERAENFKISLNNGWIHGPAYELAELELKFLQLKAGNKVEKQDSGPVQTKDVADCMMECVWTILNSQVQAWTHKALRTTELHGSLSGGFNPHSIENSPDAQVFGGLGAGAMSQRFAVQRSGGLNPARNPLAGKPGRRR
jgi:hypothetical protein